MRKSGSVFFHEAVSLDSAKFHAMVLCYHPRIPPSMLLRALKSGSLPGKSPEFGSLSIPLLRAPSLCANCVV